MKFVLDASVAMRWLGAESVPLAESIRSGILDRRLEPWVTSLWHWEMANGVVMAERRGLMDAMATAWAWKQVRAWAAEVETDPGAIDAAVGLAREHGLTAYDAGYLELALRMRVPLATLDSALIAAARAESVELF